MKYQSRSIRTGLLLSVLIFGCKTTTGEIGGSATLSASNQTQGQYECVSKEGDYFGLTKLEVAIQKDGGMTLNDVENGGKANGKYVRTVSSGAKEFEGFDDFVDSSSEVKVKISKPMVENQNSGTLYISWIQNETGTRNPLGAFSCTKTSSKATAAATGTGDKCEKLAEQAAMTKEAHGNARRLGFMDTDVKLVSNSHGTLVYVVNVYEQTSDGGSTDEFPPAPFKVTASGNADSCKISSVTAQ